jgi:hypothetical protein
MILTAAIPASGWQGETCDWEYSGTANVIRITGDLGTADLTRYYTVGLKLKWNDGAADKYGYVASSNFGTATNINIVPNSDYALSGSAIDGAAISRAAMPYGFPGWFNYSPTLPDWSGTPTAVYRFSMQGKTVTLAVSQQSGGTSNATTASLTLPVACKSLSNLYFGGANEKAVDNGLRTTGASRWITPGASGVNYVDFFTNMGSGAWTASGSKLICATIVYEAG